MEPANDNAPLGNVYKFKPAAAKLGISPRSLQALIKDNPFYARNGTVYLFSDADITKLWEAMRCHLTSKNEKDLTTGTSAAPSEVNLSSKLRALTTKRPRKQSA